MNRESRTYRLIQFLFLLASVGLVLWVCQGIARAQEPCLHISFEGGLNLRLPAIGLPPNQATEINNFDLDGGYISKRSGYFHIQDSLPGTGCIKSVYGFRFRDGRQKLVEVIDNATQSWCDLKIGNTTSRDSVGSFLYKSGDFDFTTWKDYTFISDGYNFPLAVTGNTTENQANSLHIPAPGEFYVEVLDDTNSTLDGKYRWALLTYPNCDTTTVWYTGPTDTALARLFSRHVGYITPEVTVHRRKVALHLFWPQVADSGCAAPKPLKL